MAAPPHIPSGQYVFRNVGTGMYLSSGFNYSPLAPVHVSSGSGEYVDCRWNLSSSASAADPYYLIQNSAIGLIAARNETAPVTEMQLTELPVPCGIRQGKVPYSYCLISWWWDGTSQKFTVFLPSGKEAGSKVIAQPYNPNAVTAEQSWYIISVDYSNEAMGRYPEGVSVDDKSLLRGHV